MSNIFQKKCIPYTPKQDARIAFFLGLSVLLILIIFQPFGTYNFHDINKTLILGGYGLITSIGYFVASRGFFLLFKRFKEEESWTFGKEIITFLTIFFLVVSATYFYRNFIFQLHSGFYNFLAYLSMALSIAIFPISIIFLLRYTTIKEKPVMIGQSQAIENTNTDTYLSIDGENKNEKITFIKKDLLFIKASNNYIIAYLDKDGTITKHMLRGSLSKIAKQIMDEDIWQVHRSYIVNLENVKELKGKSPNYQLQLKTSEESIPISRKKVNAIRERLQAKPI